ncbi:ent-kaurene oxidase [Pyrenochaeta sp. MPI-SDFR-AT-0127]|nr:ent-kaurene oxidase [Pyrenochaeta sp. MPI-SDFR-AT-0127]
MMEANATMPELTILKPQTITGFSQTLQTFAVATLILSLCSYIPKLRYKAQLAKIPIVGDANMQSMTIKKLYSEGYEKFKDSAFRVVTVDGDDNVIVPARFLPELRKLPDNVLSNSRNIDSLLEVKYTKVTIGALSAHSLKADLTPSLPRISPIISAEVATAVKRRLPPCDEWTEVDILSKLVDIVAQVSGCIFVGPVLAQDPDYLFCCANYSTFIMDAVQEIKSIRPVFRPFLAPRLPVVRRLREMEQRLMKHLSPIVKERQEAAKNDPNWQQPDDMLQWLLNRSDEYGTLPVEQLVSVQLGLIFGAIHTTSMTATNVLFTLAVMPGDSDLLREEMRHVLAANDNKFTNKAMQQMEKLDSYMKEVMRLFPLGTSNFGRRVLKGITLSNGQHIPPGVMIEAPTLEIYIDPAYYPDSATFDGLRHFKLRSGSKAADARHQFVIANETNLSFGYGNHACPGRFFATNEIKMILARLILDYDIKMPDNGKQERYQPIEFGPFITPAPGNMLMFKKVEV